MKKIIMNKKTQKRKIKKTNKKKKNLNPLNPRIINNLKQILMPVKWILNK